MSNNENNKKLKLISQTFYDLFEEEFYAFQYHTEKDESH